MLLSAIIAGGCALAVSAPANAGVSSFKPLHEQAEVATAQAVAAEASNELQPVERAVALPYPSDDLINLTSDIFSQFEKDPQFVEVEWSDDRSGLTVWWHGEATPELDRTIESSESIAVSIAATTFSGEDLRAAQQELVSQHGVSAWFMKEGDKIEVSAPASTTSARSSSSSALPSEVDGIPVEISAEELPEPAIGRLNDDLVMGGARVHQFSNGFLGGSCSTAFSIQNSSGIKGVFSAAHCGPPSSQWVRWPNDTGTNVYYYGNQGVMGPQTQTYDGTTIRTNNSWPYVYTGTYQAETFSQVHVGPGWSGGSSVGVGGLICYSGSYSGTSCGQTVQSNNVAYPLSTSQGQFQVQNAIRTTSGGGPVVGNGDSGGAGYQIALVGGETKRYPVSVISAIAGGSNSCIGVPGGNGRQCSGTVLSTKVTDIGPELGWGIVGF